MELLKGWITWYCLGLQERRNSGCIPNTEPSMGEKALICCSRGYVTFLWNNYVDPLKIQDLLLSGSQIKSQKPVCQVCAAVSISLQIDCIFLPQSFLHHKHSYGRGSPYSPDDSSWFKHSSSCLVSYYLAFLWRWTIRSLSANSLLQEWKQNLSVLKRDVFTLGLRPQWLCSTSSH